MTEQETDTPDAADEAPPDPVTHLTLKEAARYLGMTERNFTRYYAKRCQWIGGPRGAKYYLRTDVEAIKPQPVRVAPDGASGANSGDDGVMVTDHDMSSLTAYIARVDAERDRAIGERDAALAKADAAKAESVELARQLGEARGKLQIAVRAAELAQVAALPTRRRWLFWRK